MCVCHILINITYLLTSGQHCSNAEVAASDAAVSNSRCAHAGDAKIRIQRHPQPLHQFLCSVHRPGTIPGLSYLPACTRNSAVADRGVARIFEWGTSAEGARSEAPKVPKG